MIPPIEEKYHRDFGPIMWRAILLGEELKKYPYEQVNARQFVQLGKAVREIEKFFEIQANNINEVQN